MTFDFREVFDPVSFGYLYEYNILYIATKVIGQQIILKMGIINALGLVSEKEYPLTQIQ